MFDRKAYMKEYHKRTYQKNKTRILARNKEYQRKKKDELRLYRKEYYIKNLTKRKLYNIAYYEENREKMKANSRRQPRKTKDEKIREQAKTMALQARKMLKERRKL